MAEDFSPYMIPDSPGTWGTWPRHHHDAGDPFESGDLYLKSIPAENPSRELDELLELLTSTTNAYLANFKVDSRIPYPMRHGFDRDMELFSQHLAQQVANTYHNAIDKGVSVSKAIAQSHTVIESGMRTLSAKLNRYDREFSTWLVLESVAQQGYTRYLFLSEQGPNTCERCLTYHGQVFSLGDVPIPPIHGNCRCELLAMDSRMEAIYNSNRQGFIDAFQRAKEGADGGIFLLDHDAFPVNLTPAHLTRITLPSGRMVMDLSHPNGAGSYDLAAAAASYFSGLAADAKDLIRYLLNAQAERGENKWNSLGSFMDWLTLGIVSGTWHGIVDRHEEMVANPNLYNIVNALTGGFLDTLKGTFAPEEPWSLEHWLDILGTALTAYAAYKTAVSVKDILTGSGDDALRAGGTLADNVDDVARNAGLTRTQIDDIIKMPNGQRPEPSSYLAKEYIDHHLSQFKTGVTKIQASLKYNTIGSSQGTYVMPTSVADVLLKRANGDVKLLEDFLGLESGTLGDTPVRIDIPKPQGLRMPSGNERGANENWLPGGYTTRGIPEAVIDQVQPGNYTVRPIQ